ncbi:ammonia-dependent NAD(+) synthetase [Metabacillus herbersteinensis]|uniref:NH(3)-dependent NAD(+) synthetase n=1 Tax=Metabacillus herbersteinensis TaxID=283816 RepID=A0ABV6GCE9_9BACI
MSLQQQIIRELQVKPTINSEEEIRYRIDFLKEYLIKSKAKGYVLGISGGQDSTLAGKLAQLAVEELRQDGFDASFTSIRLPYNTQADEKDARLALEFINPDDSLIFDIASTVDEFTNAYKLTTQNTLSDFNKGNVKARTRMIAQYAVSGERNSLVIGTDHAAEAVTGFFTKYGDGGADILPLSGLSKRQGRQLLIALSAPEQLYKKIPTADLLDNKPLQADETELGISYDELDDYLEGKQVSKEVALKIDARYAATQHKRNLPSTMYDNWWK